MPLRPRRRGFLAAVSGAGFSLWASERALGALACSPWRPDGNKECVVGIELSRLLNVPARQHMTEWCWAASISMILSYYGHKVSQERIVEEAFGSIQNMPGQPADITNALSRSWTDDDGDEFLTSCEIFDVQDLIFNITVMDMLEALTARKPVLIGAAGHAMVVTAVKFVVPSAGGLAGISYVRVIDPWIGAARELDPMHSVAQYVATVTVDDG